MVQRRNKLNSQNEINSSTIRGKEETKESMPAMVHGEKNKETKQKQTNQKPN